MLHVLLLLMNVIMATVNLTLMIYYKYYWAIGVSSSLLILSLLICLLWFKDVNLTFGKMVSLLTVWYGVVCGMFGYTWKRYNTDSPFLYFVIHVAASYTLNLLLLVLVMIKDGNNMASKREDEQETSSPTVVIHNAR